VDGEAVTPLVRMIRGIMAVAAGKARQVHPLMWVVAALFVVYFVVEPIKSLLT
jgi:AGZA family xanthine/uracil permease-like MFS transporter